jgi:hypothetical protein
MQPSEKTADECTRENKIDTFQAEEFFDPRADVRNTRTYRLVGCSGFSICAMRSSA